jgi:hypothetical protein
MIFVDLDLVNSFHQVKLAPLTAARLSIQCPSWGQVQPKFMPEGIGSMIVAALFSGFEE